MENRSAVARPRAGGVCDHKETALGVTELFCVPIMMGTVTKSTHVLKSIELNTETKVNFTVCQSFFKGQGQQDSGQYITGPTLAASQHIVK